MKTKLLDLLISSEKRKNLLMILREGPKNLADIRESLNVTSSGVIPQIRMLEQRNLISQDEKGYVLTDTGRLLSNYLYPLIKIVDFIEENEDYWNTHDFTVIPDHLLLRLYELGACKVDEVDLNTMYEPHRLFFESLSKSIWIKGVTPVYNPSYPEFLVNLARAGKKISLILAPEVFERCKKDNSALLEEFRTYDTEIYIFNDELKIASVVTDCYISLTPFLSSGGYDSRKNFICTDNSSILWGEDLFEYLLNNSVKVL